MGVCILSRFSRVQLCDPMDGSPWLFCPWNSPGKNTGVGYHALTHIFVPWEESQIYQFRGSLQGYGLFFVKDVSGEDKL